ncbi:MAG: hypothetical protein AAFR11_10125 [Pseudomonadota bacterium]
MLTRSLIAALLAAAATGGVAYAGADDQVEACKIYMDEQGMLDVENYRFKYEGAKGGRVKTVDILVIPLAEGPKYEAACKLRSGSVESVELTEA